MSVSKIKAPSKETILEADAILKRGGLVAVPTETVYGLAADVSNNTAIRKIFQVKNRPFTDPLIVHLASINQLELVANLSLNKVASKRLEKLVHLWPGPLTLLMPKANTVPELVTSGLPNVALRIPDHAVTLELLKVSGLALAAPSANPFSYVSPTTALHVQEMLGDKIDLILDGGPCKVGVESTILSLVGATPTLLRPGIITVEQLSSTLNEEIEINTGSDKKELQAQLAAGMFEKHYSPHTKCVLITDFVATNEQRKVGIIWFKEGSTLKQTFSIERRLSSNADLESVARNLYATLRELDNLKLDLIVIDTCEDSGIGAAIMNRVRKAVS